MKICRYLWAFVLLEMGQYGEAAAILGTVAEWLSSPLNFSLGAMLVC